MIGTSCIARTLKNQLNNNDRFHQLTQKYSPMIFPCNIIQGDIWICPNHVDSNMNTYADIDPQQFQCNSINFHGNVNTSNTNDDCHFYHSSGNVTATVSTNHAYNSNTITSDNMIADIIPPGVYNYIIDASINLCMGKLNFNLTLCNNSSCVVYDPNGMYAVVDSNSTCTHYIMRATIHSINKTDKYIYINKYILLHHVTNLLYYILSFL